MIIVREFGSESGVVGVIVEIDLSTDGPDPAGVGVDYSASDVNARDEAHLRCGLLAQGAD